jgi:predicted patatin/cPLA2 family phospholipase
MYVENGRVLEGGGLRGNYTAGVLDAFLEAGVEFPYIIGVSAGAGMGCSFVSRQRGRNLEILKKYRDDKRYLSFRNYLKTGSIFGMEFVFHTIPEKLIPFDYATFAASASRFVTVCTDCTTGEAVYYEKTQHGGSQPLPPENFYRILEASASMPYVAPMVSYDGRQLLDGAIVDAIPLAKAVEAGFSRNVCVLTNPAGYCKKEDPHPPNGLFYHGRKKLIQALLERVNRYNQTLAWVEEEGKNGGLVVIRPSKDLHVSRVEKSIEKLLALYELGLADCRAACMLHRFSRY